jgi:solute carrier family 25 (mitochondrial S-adenosylmethionine transporter), member 26
MGREAPVLDGDHARTFAADLVAGGIAGVVADSIIHPVDTVKARMQVMRALPGRSPKYASMADGFRTIARKEGVWRGLYAGYGTVLLGTIPTHGIMFAVYKMLKRSAEPQVDDSSLALVDFAAAAGGEAIALVPYVPAEVVAKRMQIAGLGPARDYRSTSHALRVIHATEGVRGLYSGLGSTVLRDVPFAAIQLTLFSTGKDMHRRFTGQADLSDMEATGLGFIVGIIGAAATNPADVVKTRLQTQAAGSERKYHGILHCFRRIVAEEGLVGLTRGMVPRIAWVAPGSAITLAVYERVSRSLRPPSLRPPLPMSS